MDLLPTHSFNCDGPLGPRKWTDDDDCQGGGLHHVWRKRTMLGVLSGIGEGVCLAVGGEGGV